MTISKSFELSSAPTCQNLDKSPRKHFPHFFFFFFSCGAPASLDTVQKVTNVRGKKRMTFDKGCELLSHPQLCTCNSHPNSWNLLDAADFLRSISAVIHYQ